MVARFQATIILETTKAQRLEEKNLCAFVPLWLDKKQADYADD
jgi:hypothetical protein